MLYFLFTFVFVVTAGQDVLLPPRKVPFAAPIIKINTETAETKHLLVPASVLHDSLERLISSNPSPVHSTRKSHSMKVVVQSTTSMMSTFVWPHQKDTASSSLLKRSADLYSLRVSFRDEGYAELFLSNKTAVPFCKGVSTSLFQDSTEYFVDLKLDFRNGTPTIPVREDEAVAFCRTVREREGTEGKELTKTALSNGANTRDPKPKPTETKNADVAETATASYPKGGMNSTPKSTKAIPTDTRSTPLALPPNVGKEGRPEDTEVPPFSSSTSAPVNYSKSQPTANGKTASELGDILKSDNGATPSRTANGDISESSVPRTTRTKLASTQSLKSKAESLTRATLVPSKSMSLGNTDLSTPVASQASISLQDSESQEDIPEISSEVSTNKILAISKSPLTASFSSALSVADDTVLVAEISHEQKFNESDTTISRELAVSEINPTITTAPDFAEETLRVQEDRHQPSATQKARSTIWSIDSLNSYGDSEMPNDYPIGTAISARAWQNAGARPSVFGAGLWSRRNLGVLTKFMIHERRVQAMKTEPRSSIEDPEVNNDASATELAPVDEDLVPTETSVEPSPSTSRELAKQRPHPTVSSPIIASRPTKPAASRSSQFKKPHPTSKHKYPIENETEPTDEETSTTPSPKKPSAPENAYTDSSPTTFPNPETTSYSFPSASAARLPSNKLPKPTATPSSRRLPSPKPTHEPSNITAVNDQGPGSLAANSTLPIVTSNLTISHDGTNVTNISSDHTTQEPEHGQLSTAFGGIEDHRDLWAVVFVWILVLLQVVMSIWEFGRSAWGWKGRAYGRVFWKV